MFRYIYWIRRRKYSNFCCQKIFWSNFIKKSKKHLMRWITKMSLIIKTLGTSNIAKISYIIEECGEHILIIVLSKTLSKCWLMRLVWIVSYLFTLKKTFLNFGGILNSVAAYLGGFLLKMSYFGLSFHQKNSMKIQICLNSKFSLKTKYI